MELKFDACLSHQNLLEFFSVVTSPKRVERPVSPEEALYWVSTNVNNNYFNWNNDKKVENIKGSVFVRIIIF
jgi:hypothetical protein